MSKRKHDAGTTGMSDANYRSRSAWRGQQKRRGRPLDLGGVVNVDAQEIVDSDDMYAALKPAILALRSQNPLWTEQTLTQQFTILYNSYVEMNAVSPYAFEARAVNKVAGGMTAKSKIFSLMKRYLLEKQSATSALV